MSMFTLAISCLTTSNLPWFMVLTFQVPMQYCSLQHWTLLSPPVTSTTGCHFCFGSASSFLLELFLCSSPVVYWSPTILGFHLSMSYLFSFSYCSCGSQDKNAEVVCHSLLQWTMFCQNSPPWPHPSWVTIHVSLSSTKLWSMWSFWLVFCDCGFHSVCPLTDEDKRFVQASWWEGLAVRKARSALMGRVMLSKSLIQFLLINGAVFGLGQTMVGEMVTSPKRTYESMS